MNGNVRKKMYVIISKRDGEHCNFCRKLSSEGQLVIDHKDNDNSNNSIENYQLLCRGCNYRKNPRRPVDICVSENVSEINEIQINRTKEPQFKKMLAQLINEYSIYPINDLKNSIAEKLDLSPVTVKRYLDKVCSSQGIYEITKSGKTLAVRYKKELPFT
jgi:hypothetical protein